MCAIDDEPGPFDIYTAKLAKIPRSYVNYGISVRIDAYGARPTSMGVLDVAINEYRNLIRQLHGETKIGEASLEV